MYYAGKRVQRDDLERGVKKERIQTRRPEKMDGFKQGDQNRGVVLYRETKTEGWF